MVGRPFEKGKSGNPGGRPKAALDLQALARAQTKQSLETLIEVRDKATNPPAARVAAAAHILDRGWGKPAQAVQQGGHNGYTLEQLIAYPGIERGEYQPRLQTSARATSSLRQNDLDERRQCRSEP